jgi:hypothetical protein
LDRGRNKKKADRVVPGLSDLNKWIFPGWFNEIFPKDRSMLGESRLITASGHHQKCIDQFHL